MILPFFFQRFEMMVITQPFETTIEFSKLLKWEDAMPCALIDELIALMSVIGSFFFFNCSKFILSTESLSLNIDNAFSNPIKLAAVGLRVCNNFQSAIVDVPSLSLGNRSINWACCYNINYWSKYIIQNH